MRFSLGLGNNTKIIFKLFGLTGGVVWHITPTLMCGSLYAKKYEALKQVPIKDYFIQFNWLCFTLVDIFIVRRQKDFVSEPVSNNEVQPQPQLNRSIRRKLKRVK